MKRSDIRRRGTALIIALTSASILAGMGAATFMVINSKYRVVHQAAAWDEALLSAEAGIEMAMNEIRKDLFDPANAWANWGKTTVDVPTALGGSVSATTFYRTSETLLRTGEGGQSSSAQVTVDEPVCLHDPSTGEPWFRIRAIGVAELPGGRIVAGDKQDNRLRRFSLVHDRRKTLLAGFAEPLLEPGGSTLANPITTRIIEAVAKPVGAFRLALFGLKTIDMNNHNIVVDSYDSRDPLKSTNGRWDSTKRQENGHIATNGHVIHAGGAQIYGDASTNGGKVLDSERVTGEIRDDFYQEVFPVRRPIVAADPLTPGAVNGATTFTAKPLAPSNYQLSALSLSGPDILHIQGAADGSPTYCQIVVTGNISMSGQSQIKMDPNVYLRIFVQGNADIAGQGFANPNSPLHLQIYGCDRINADGSPGPKGTMKIAGNGGFAGSVYAPNYNITMVGGGTTDSIYGAFVGDTVSMTGVQSVHYDEALGDGGLISDYKIVSWFEDER